jgi:uncharacterized membrane protein
MNVIKEQARSAGFLYLLLAIIAPIGLIVIPNQLIVSGDATATADRILESGPLWGIGIALELTASIIFVFLAVALYRLFKRVNESHALLMMILALVSVPISFLSTSFEIIAESIYSGPGFLSDLDKAALDSLGYMFLRMHTEGKGVETIFWGLWLFPFGLLVMRSGFIPRFLGVLLLAAGCGYVIGFFCPLLLPHYSSVIGQITMVLVFGELPIVFWLLIWGARVKPTEAPTS